MAYIEDNDWIRDPFNQESESSNEKLTMKEREESAELRADRTLKLKFSELTLDQFWLVCASEYPTISHHAIDQLLHFPTTYLCELAFSTLVYMKNKTRSRLSVEQDLRVALSSVPPRIKKICAPRQAHVSHWFVSRQNIYKKSLILNVTGIICGSDSGPCSFLMDSSLLNFCFLCLTCLVEMGVFD